MTRRKLLISMLAPIILIGCNTTQSGLTYRNAEESLEVIFNSELVAEDLDVVIDYENKTFRMTAKNWVSAKQGVLRESYKGKKLLIDSSGRVIGTIGGTAVRAFVTKGM